uniref:uncharacterized protein LOC122607233 n=1 Tax=Erigeron canadensis TaxID=72917 RepID=UPI001CB8CFEE|nr:uncharacterized protein LOC122607233 [Erigeron canadensis]
MTVLLMKIIVVCTMILLFEPSLFLTYLLECSPGYPCVVGSSHGLLCFKIIEKDYNYDYSNFNINEMVVLWKLSIWKLIRIPVPDFPNYNFSIYMSGNSNYGDDDVVGFGVCPVTFDPTILKIKRIDYRSEAKDKCLLWRVRVFTLSRGTWSILSTGLHCESIRLRGSEVVIDKFIYWVAFDMLHSKDGQSPFLVMSFDLTAKEFKEINLTDCLSNRLCRIQTISELRESLVLIEYHKEKGVSVCCLWMMKEQGVNRSFTKLYNINVPHCHMPK